MEQQVSGILLKMGTHDTQEHSVFAIADKISRLEVTVLRAVNQHTVRISEEIDKIKKI